MTDSMLQHIEEPRLAFRYSQELEHPKDGLFLFGPLDDRANPAEMRIGVIGTLGGLNCFRAWAESIRRYIPPKDHNEPHHAGWPGFQGVFGARWPKEPLVELTVSKNDSIIRSGSLTGTRQYTRQSSFSRSLYASIYAKTKHRLLCGSLSYRKRCTATGDLSRSYRRRNGLRETSLSPPRPGGGFSAKVRFFPNTKKPRKFTATSLIFTTR